MGTYPRDFPPGDLRISDADRDRALSELSRAFEVGRLTADEFDQRSAQVLRSRTGKELTALLADLPVDHAPVYHTALRRTDHVLARRVAVGVSVVAAFFAAVAVTNALSYPSRGFQCAAGACVRMLVLRHQGFDWAGTITPAAIAVLLVVLVLFLCNIGADRA